MSLNPVGTQQIKKEQLLESQGLQWREGCSLPIDIGRIIFTYAKSNLDYMALVSKNWVALAEDKKCLEMIRACTPEISGVNDWQERIKVNKIVDELPIPRCIYREVEEGWIYTFVPKEVTVINGKGEEVIVKINTLRALGDLFKKPITDLETGFIKDPWTEAIEEPRTTEEPHWVGIKPKVIGKKLAYIQQLKLAEEEDIKAYGDNSAMDIDSPEVTDEDSAATQSVEQVKQNKRQQVIKISDLIDTAATAFMVYTKSGNKIRLFVIDDENKVYDLVRVNEQTNEQRIWLGFASSGLSVSIHFDSANAYVGFVFARKSFVH
jgi:hypothetical protein